MDKTKTLKISETEIEVTKTEVPKVTKQTYTLQFLLEQKANIEAQRDSQWEQQTKALAEVENLLLEFDI